MVTGAPKGVEGEERATWGATLAVQTAGKEVVEMQVAGVAGSLEDLDQSLEWSASG